MNQTPSHSQTPTFGHIPSTGILYQHPPSTKQIAKANKVAKFKTVAQDIFAALLFLSIIGSAPFMVKSCAEDVDRQTVQAVKFQMEVK